MSPADTGRVAKDGDTPNSSADASSPPPKTSGYGSRSAQSQTSCTALEDSRVESKTWGIDPKESELTLQKKLLE